MVDSEEEEKAAAAAEEKGWEAEEAMEAVKAAVKATAEDAERILMYTRTN